MSKRINEILLILFVSLFFQTHINIIVSFLPLLVALLLRLWDFNFKVRAKVLYVITVFVLLESTYIFNILLHSFNSEPPLYKELCHYQFFRYDGKLFVLPAIFLVIFIVSKVDAYVFFRKMAIILTLEEILYNIAFGKHEDYLTEPFLTHDALGGFASSLIILGFFIFKEDKLLGMLIMIVNLFFLLLSASRGFLVAISLVVLIYLTIRNRKFLVLYLIFLTLILVFIYELNFDIARRIMHPNFTDNFNIIFRIEAQKLAILTWIKNIYNFIFGIGIGRIDDILQVLMPFYTETEIRVGQFFFSQIHPHNTFLTILSEQGIIGILSFLSAHVYVLIQINRIADRNIKDLVILLFVLLVISSLFSNSFFSPSNAGIFYIVTAVSLRDAIRKHYNIRYYTLF